MTKIDEMIAHLQDFEVEVSNMAEWLKENRNGNPHINKTVLDNAIERLRNAHEALLLLLKELGK